MFYAPPGLNLKATGSAGGFLATLCAHRPTAPASEQPKTFQSDIYQIASISSDKFWPRVVSTVIMPFSERKSPFRQGAATGRQAGVSGGLDYS